MPVKSLREGAGTDRCAQRSGSSSNDTAPPQTRRAWGVGYCVCLSRVRGIGVGKMPLRPENKVKKREIRKMREIGVPMATALSVSRKLDRGNVMAITMDGHHIIKHHTDGLWLKT